ncbi:MAG: cytochrome c oxidase subunit 3 [Armatimonadetes bacterium]|nr:cytochrome c oxidase subunit 3 [Armatimonadota bacterium]
MASTAVDTHAHHHPGLHHQFEDIEQQNEAYLVGMWSFMVNEIMFFGGVFLVYCLYRWRYQDDFYAIHHELNWKMGAFNTTVLLFSSFSMVMAVHFATLKDRMKTLMNLALTCACAFTFLIVKYFEYGAKFEHKLFPGPNFRPELEHLNGANPNVAQLFMSLYFGITGLHALHIIIGILIIGILMGFWYKKNPLVTEDFLPTEMVGLYWHFVDLVWIFLFPLFYLIPR